MSNPFMPHGEIETASGPLYVEYARETTAETPIDMHRVLKTGDIPDGVSQKGDVARQLIEVDSWLPFAAEKLGISSSLKDLIVVPTTIFLTEIPNSNLAAFTFQEMSSWNTQAGAITYQTWCRKAAHIEHANTDPSKAAGIILDSSLRLVPNYVGNLHRVVLLAGWDRYRYPELAQRVLAGRSGFSMGCFCQDYHCSVCQASLRSGGCVHVHPKLGPRMVSQGNKLVYRIATGCLGFELSAVKNPANRSSWGLSIDLD